VCMRNSDLAQVVARLRLCLLNEDLAEAGVTLEAVRGKMLASVAMSEVRLVQDEVDNWQVISDLTSGITRGGAGGTPGNLDLSVVDTSALERAITKAEELGVKTSEATSLYEAGQVLLRLRVALQGDRWDALSGGGGIGSLPSSPEGSGRPSRAGSEAGADGAAVGGGREGETVEDILREVAGAPLSELALPEVTLLQQEIDNRRMIVALSKALAAGGARGAVGELDLTGVDTAALDTAVAEATELGPKTETAERLLSAAKLIRRLRSVLLAGNWQWVGSALLEARTMKHVFPAVSLKELQLAQDELDNRAIIVQLNAALKVGVLCGPIGQPDTAAIDTAALDEALAYAKTLGVKSAEASQVVATAQFVRKLRMALKSGDFTQAQELLECEC